MVGFDVDGFECECFAAPRRCFGHTRPILVMELAPYVLEERGASLEQLSLLLHSERLFFFDERTGKPLPSGAKELQRMLADGESMNVVARVP